MKPIYPVPVKPPTTINRWQAWPRDVVRTLWAMNHSGSFRSALSFVRSNRVFKCPDCEVFCLPHVQGAAVLKGDWLCDECLIMRARGMPWRDHPSVVRLVWHMGYWDGPLSGVCEVHGIPCLFRLYGDELARRRLYVIEHLTPDERQLLADRHELFRRYVGTHCDYVYDADGRPSRAPGSVRRGDQQHRFYDAPLEPLPDRVRATVGVFSIAPQQFPEWMAER